MSIVWQILLLAVGFTLLLKGADWFVEGASGIARKFKIPELIIGLTVVAFGTSAPEAAVSITAGIKQTSEIAIGNVVGSNILNVLLILGITGLVSPIGIQICTLKYEIPFMIVITTGLLFLGMSGNQLSFADGVILWLGFVLFFVYLIYMAKTGKMKSDEVTEEKQKSVFKIFLFTIIGIVSIILGSNFTVDASTAIARAIGIDERIIGLTLVAFGTSLPELVTSVIAAKKGKADLAIGNIVGSNIFNILFILGTTSLISPIPFAQSFIWDTLVAIAAGVMLLICVLPKKKLGRISGVAMLCAYGGYFVYLLLG